MCQQVYFDNSLVASCRPITSNAQITKKTFSLLSHADEQNLYFDNFFYDKYTCSKASMLAFEEVHLS